MVFGELKSHSFLEEIMAKAFKEPAYQAFRILQFVFVVAPILAGLDKFFYLMTNWNDYLSPFALQFVTGHERMFFGFVGVVEIIAGIGVFFRPGFFAYIISLWLVGIIVNLVMSGHYYDVALRDLGLLLSAIALGKLSRQYA